MIDSWKRRVGRRGLGLVAAAALVAGGVAPAAGGTTGVEESASGVLAEVQSADGAAHKLMASSQSGGYSFGYAVAVDDDVIVVGAPRAMGDQGRAYIVYDYEGAGSFSAYGLNCEHDFMTFPDGNCGRSVAVNGDLVAVGIPHWPKQPNLDDRGAVWVAEHTGASWESWPLVSGSALGGYFGESVAVEGTTLAIGAPLAGVNSSSSRVRVYAPTGPPDSGHWALEQTLEPASGDPNFAWNLAIDGDRLALGVTGAAYVFDRAGGDYVQVKKFDYGTDGKVDVALDGNWLVVGNHDEGGGPPGAVHVYEWNGSRYVERTVLTPPDNDHELYGWSVAISGDTILVGDPRNHGAAAYAGAVHRYAYDAGSWSFVETLTAFDASAESQFGWAVAIAEDWVVLGAPWDDEAGSDAGAVYIYANEGSPQPPIECNGLTPTILGTGGNDYLLGTSGFDIIAGLGGNDFIDGRGGDDLICGGPGKDEIHGGSGIDHIFGNAGDDFITGDQMWDIISGGAGDDTIIGGAGDDIIYGNGGDDYLHGNGGEDSLYGGPGRDRLVGDAGPDFLRGGGAVDTASYVGAGSAIEVDLSIGIVTIGAVDDSLTSVERVIGSAFPDVMVGNAKVNEFLGKAGADTLYGKGGDDVLKGGKCPDTAYGGRGRDLCRAEVKKSCEI